MLCQCCLYTVTLLLQEAALDQYLWPRHPFSLCRPAPQVGTLTLSSIFTGLVLASKKMWAACLVLLATQPAALWVFHRCAEWGGRGWWCMQPMQL